MSKNPQVIEAYMGTGSGAAMAEAQLAVRDCTAGMARATSCTA